MVDEKTSTDTGSLTVWTTKGRVACEIRLVIKVVCRRVVGPDECKSQFTFIIRSSSLGLLSKQTMRFMNEFSRSISIKAESAG